MVTELGKQLLFPFFGATAFAFIDHLAEVGVVRDGIVLLVVMRKESHRSFILYVARLGGADEHHHCRTTWNVVKKQFGGKVLAVDVEGHVNWINFSLKRFIVKPYVGLVSKNRKYFIHTIYACKEVVIVFLLVNDFHFDTF